MFRRKRRFYEKKSFYAAVLSAFAVALVFGLWSEDSAVEGQEENPVDHQVMSGEIPSSSLGLAEFEAPDVTGEESQETGRRLQEGYFVVEEEGYIRIYQVDGQGKQSLVRTSELRFDLLSREDQDMFRSGVELRDEDQLMELLQDFES